MVALCHSRWHQDCVLTKTQLLSGAHKQLHRFDSDSQELEYLKISTAPNPYLAAHQQKGERGFTIGRE